MKTIQSVEKAINIVNHIAQHNGKLNLTEISKNLSISITTLHGFIATLEKCEMIKKDSHTGKYVLGNLILKYNAVFNAQEAFVDMAIPFLEALRDETKETVHLALPFESNQVQYIAKAESPYPFRLTSLVGTFENATDSALGYLFFPLPTTKDLELDENKGLTYCLKYETDIDAYCLATKLLAPHINTLAGISLVIPRIRYEQQGKDFYLEALTKQTIELSNSLHAL